MMYFVPLLQRPPSETLPIDKDEDIYAGAIVLKTNRPIPEAEKLVRKTLASINSDMSVVKFQSFQAQIAEQFSEPRMLSRLMTLFGGLALLLATLGLYGVTAYTVARRTGEIGIRMALGAKRGGITAMVMLSALLQAVVGLLIGIPVAMICVRYVESQLYDIKGVNIVILAGAVSTLITTAALAGLVPARRAASIDPAQALRSE
jgi:ABC-type antimicrobial peptide transport system permease subunit